MGELKPVDVVRTLKDEYGVATAVKIENGTERAVVNIVGKGPVTYMQSKLTLVEDLSGLSDELRYQLDVQKARLEADKKVKVDYSPNSGSKKDPHKSYIGLAGCMLYFKDWFRTEYKGGEGFRDESFVREERTYRIKCKELFDADLNETAFKKLLERKDYDEIFRLATAIYTPRKNGECEYCMLNYVNDRNGDLTNYRKAILRRSRAALKNGPSCFMLFFTQTT